MNTFRSRERATVDKAARHHVKKGPEINGYRGGQINLPVNSKVIGPVPNWIGSGNIFDLYKIQLLNILPSIDYAAYIKSSPRRWRNTIISEEAVLKLMGWKTVTGAIAATLLMGQASPGLAEDLVAYEIVDETSIPEPLTGAVGDSDKGRETFIDRKLGNCLGCHAVSELEAEPFHGEVGPPLDGVANRYEEGELRLQVVNAKVANPDTIMPGFYVVDGLNRVMPDFAGKPVLTAGQVEDIVAYLKTLTEG